MKKIYILINGKKGTNCENNRCNWMGKKVIENKRDFYIRESNFDEITIFNFNNRNYVCERKFTGNSGVGSMDFIIHGFLDHVSINENYNKIYYKEFNGNENLDDLVKNYEENVIQKKNYSAWQYTFEVINNPEYDIGIQRIPLNKKIKNIISITYELIKDLFF